MGREERLEIEVRLILVMAAFAGLVHGSEIKTVAFPDIRVSFSVDKATKELL